MTKILPLIIAATILFIGCSKSPSSNPPNNGNGNGNGGNGVAVFVLQGNGSTCSSSSANGTYTQGTSLTSSNTLSVQVNVTTIGTWSISTNTVSGFSFSGSGTFTSTGVQSVSFAGSGTPGAPGPQIFTVTAGNSSCTFQVTVNSSGNGVNDSSGVTLIRGTGGTSLYYDWTSHGELGNFLSQDGFSSLVGLDFDSNAVVRTKLVNALVGTMTATPEVNNFQYTSYKIDFSNINNYTNTSQVANPDTAGKLQIWIYRADGKDIKAASGGHPAVKRIIYIPGKFPATPPVGIIKLYDYDFPGYPVHPPPITTVVILENIFSTARWKIDPTQFTWPW